MADLYINWALFFDQKGNLAKADEIFRLGFTSFAMPIDLLRHAHKEFGFSMSQQFFYSPNHALCLENELRMEKLREEMSALRISGTVPKHSKSSALHLFDRSGLLPTCIPKVTSQPSTPEKLNTSIVHQIIDTLEKKRREQSERPKLGANRLDFLENSLTNAKKLDKPINYDLKPIRLPTKVPTRTATTACNNLSTKSFNNTGSESSSYLKDSGYDSIGLYSSRHSPFLTRHLNGTSEEIGKWVTLRKPLCKTEWMCIDSNPLNEEIGLHKFMTPMTKIYPKNSRDEYSIEEIMWQKRKPKNIAKEAKPLLNRLLYTNQNKSKWASVAIKISAALEVKSILTQNAKSKKPAPDPSKLPKFAIYRQNSREAIPKKADNIKSKELQNTIFDNKENEFVESNYAWQQSTPKKDKSTSIRNFIAKRPKANGLETVLKRPKGPAGSSTISRMILEEALNANTVNNIKSKTFGKNIYNDKQFKLKNAPPTPPKKNQTKTEKNLLQNIKLIGNNAPKRLKAPPMDYFNLLQKSHDAFNTDVKKKIKPKELRFTLVGAEDVFNLNHDDLLNCPTPDLATYLSSDRSKATKLKLSNALVDVFKGTDILYIANKQWMELHDDNDGDRSTVKNSMSVKKKPYCPVRAMEPAQKYSFSYELLETTEEFERLEAMCNVDPTTNSHNQK